MQVFLRHTFIEVLRPTALTFLVCAASWCGEFAVLESGFRLRIERHERIQDKLRLYTSQEGFVELPACSVVSFEAEEAASAVSPPASPIQAESSHRPAPTPKELVEQSALNYTLPPGFLHLVAKAESGYRADALSPKGAIGIMQLMPATAAALGVDPRDPRQNVEAGTRYLRDLLIRYQQYPDQLRRALAAYNAGPGAVVRYNGVPPYRETQLYVDKIVEAWKRTRDLRSSPD
ncbi:MAG: lytic transglycosylase domain-containing protein [Acidobacteria bacterium]|nr:lytic transglycosylase domain-containing protein [Acidobacteriota bacterium]